MESPVERSDKAHPMEALVARSGALTKFAQNMLREANPTAVKVIRNGCFSPGRKIIEALSGLYPFEAEGIRHFKGRTGAGGSRGGNRM